MNRRLFAGVLAGVLALSMLGGCGSGKPDPTTPTTTTNAPTTTTTAPTVVVTLTTNNNTNNPADEAMYNRLTGEYNNAGGGDSRPVAVMVPNDNQTNGARPQVGLTEADIFFETETEGGIPRIMAVFADVSRVPSMLAPIRSARTPFVKMAQSLDSIYIHVGGSTGADAMLDSLVANGKLDRIDGNGSSGNAFWRDKTVLSGRKYEHTLSTSGERLATRIGEKGYRTTSSVTPFTFGTQVIGNSCGEVTVKLSNAQTNTFKYNAETGLYTKYFGASSEGDTHVDIEGTAITVSNVLVMYDDKYAESSKHIGFPLESGNGILCSGGTVRNVQWTRTDTGFAVTENGQAATFLPGKTYICLTDTDLKSNTVLK